MLLRRQLAYKLQALIRQLPVTSDLRPKCPTPDTFDLAMYGAT